MKTSAAALIAILLGLFSVHDANAQKKNAIRAGAGINIHQGLTVGPSQFIEYNREINRYFSVGANFHTDLTIMQDHSAVNKFGLSLRGMASPLAFIKWLRWIEVGAGLTYEYRQCIWEEVSETHIYDIRYNYFGIDFPFRAYFIDSDRFELFAFYEIKTVLFYTTRKLFVNPGYFWNYSNAGISFGIKF